MYLLKNFKMKIWTCGCTQVNRKREGGGEGGKNSERVIQVDNERQHSDIFVSNDVIGIF